MIYITCFSHGDQKISPQLQGFQILPSLSGHFVPITYGIVKCTVDILNEPFLGLQVHNLTIIS